MTQGADPYGLQQPAANPDPLAGGALPGVGYTAYDPITGQPMTSGPVDGNPYPASNGYPSPTAAPGYPQGASYPPANHPPAGYASQPPAGYPGPTAAPLVYPVAGQLPPGYPAQYPPGYPQAYPSGYPQGVQLVPMYGYPMAPAKPSRPGGATAAAVLAFVQGGFVLIGGVTVLSGATEFGFTSTYSSTTSEFSVVAIITLLAGALLIAGGATLLSRKTTWMMAGCLVSLGVSVYWVIRISGIRYAEFGLWAPIVYAILPIISIALTMSGDVRGWIRTR